MDKKKVVIIDYKLSNLFSVSHACDHVGINAVVSSDPKDIEGADAIILPGVGAFHTAVENLESLEMIRPIKDFIAGGKPFMGICLGLQLLFTESEEFGNHKGLDIIKGKILKFPRVDEAGENYKVPQIGWNKIKPLANASFSATPLDGIPEGSYMYFVHSFYAEPESTKNILTLTDYSKLNYCSGILKNNIFALQFHPEKSGVLGLKIYENWASMNGLI